MDSFWPQRHAVYGLPQGPLLHWEYVGGGGPTAIDIDQVKTFLNIPIEDDSFNPEKQAFNIAAQAAVEHYCQISLLTTTWVGYAPRFYDEMRLIRRPFDSVVSVDYVDAVTGIVTTLDPSVYVAGKAGQRCGVVMLGADQQWPCAAMRPDAVRITVTAGWAKPKIPAELISAVMMTIAALDHARGDDGQQGSAGRNTVYAMKHQMAPSILPETAKAMVSRYRYIAMGTT